jgi:hypothetical protein
MFYNIQLLQHTRGKRQWTRVEEQRDEILLFLLSYCLVKDQTKAKKNN